MNPDSPPRHASEKTGQKANPVAVFGVLLIVLFSILLGVFGPRVSDYRRGQFVSGQPVIDFLQGVPAVYLRKAREMSGILRRSGSRPATLSSGSLETALRARFDSVDPPFLPGSSTFDIVSVDDNVDLLALSVNDSGSESGLSVFYLPREGDLDVSKGVFMLVRSLQEGSEAIYLRDEFGIPKLIQEGVIYRDLVNDPLTQMSLNFWTMDGFFYVSVGSSPELLDEYMESLDLVPVIEDPISSV